ncbi:thiamine pyrophosphate-dependent enzyme [Saccharopolyspora hattusasensis]|uniref:thiamine pyrophosphate-dependent enzyme n=1 Tax=Saccharopolyspora hattusasensis TaxID=1128679 RepID=UPI003D99B7DB
MHQAAGEAVARAREGGGPTLIEVKLTHCYGHFEGDQQACRGEDVSRARRDLDCLRRFRARVTGAGFRRSGWPLLGCGWWSWMRLRRGAA